MSKYVPAGMETPVESAHDVIPLLKFLGITLIGKREDGITVAEMPVTENIMNLQQVPHGGAIATLADFCAGLAVPLTLGSRCSTADLQIRFLDATKGTKLIAEAEIIRPGKRIVVVETRIKDDLGKLVALVTMAMAPFPNSSPAS